MVDFLHLKQTVLKILFAEYSIVTLYLLFVHSVERVNIIVLGASEVSLGLMISFTPTVNNVNSLKTQEWTV